MILRRRLRPEAGGGVDRDVRREEVGEDCEEEDGTGRGGGMALASASASSSATFAIARVLREERRVLVLLGVEGMLYRAKLA